MSEESLPAACASAVNQIRLLATLENDVKHLKDGAIRTDSRLSGIEANIAKQTLIMQSLSWRLILVVVVVMSGGQLVIPKIQSLMGF